MLSQLESRILSALSSRVQSDELSRSLGIPVSSLLSAAQSLKEKGYVATEAVEVRKVELSEEGRRFAKDGLPEEAVLEKAKSGASIPSLSQEERALGVSWAIKNGWIKIEGGELRAISQSSAGYPIAILLKKAAQGETLSDEEAAQLTRRKLATVSLAKTIFIEPTAVMPPKMEGAAGEESIVTRQMLLDKSYKGKSFKKYDVNAMADIPPIAKRHMVSLLKNRISRIFTDMGFEEMGGDEIQPSFWNFDALFQPQDHPARDLADTFYLKGSSPLPADEALISRIKKTHEKFWGGEWKEDRAATSVLRTHTTCLSARYLYGECQEKGKARKFFSIGKVYRNEATDYKHLAEFFQVEGIVAWEGATFCDLLGCLREFYKKLGFEKIRFQPSYFPYTEPSLEISVYFEEKGQWLELGGAGIFRPEVSIPLCDRYPVLAWGLSLERPLMLLNSMNDIRDFYRSNAGWLRRQKMKE
jgi:phenylalanyl-tRNA synthetase alpha chain